ncbi:hypothetical protein MPH_07553 [Macrophomina phaseolina MS6]|uniref:Uncharacterized protein n=1 Tax=Macrophomina phaseolina (strain MS6) TaxID=1126212 RepID=K2RYE4_MACPH|nr:hypothetical protein MPH_07553 [Macrophomina phaseolina MS6]
MIDLSAILQFCWAQLGSVVRVIGLKDGEEVSSLGKLLQWALKRRLGQWQYAGWGSAVDEDGELQRQLLNCGEGIFENVPDNQLSGKRGTLRITKDAVERAVVCKA